MTDNSCYVCINTTSEVKTYLGIVRQLTQVSLDVPGPIWVSGWFSLVPKRMKSILLTKVAVVTSPTTSNWILCTKLVDQGIEILINQDSDPGLGTQIYLIWYLFPYSPVLVRTNPYFRLPRQHNDKESTYKCRRYRFYPWVRKIPWNRKWQPLQHSCLENSMDREAWQATVHRVLKSWHNWVQHGTCPNSTGNNQSDCHPIRWKIWKRLKAGNWHQVYWNQVPLLSLWLMSLSKIIIPFLVQYLFSLGLKVIKERWGLKTNRTFWGSLAQKPLCAPCFLVCRK